jgi:excinuclease ABC subunit A
MYILDEPSIGLHPRDTKKLIDVLKNLRDLGNTVIIVEHEEDIMKEADEILDIGPMAGIYGGEVVFQGNDTQLRNQKQSLTAQYLTKERVIPIPATKRKPRNWIKIIGARENNLQNVSVDIPLFTLLCVTGVSGSGKSTLIKDILYPAIRKQLGVFGDFQGEVKSVEGDLKFVKGIELIDQNPIGKSSRSNPVTYVKAFDEIRDLYARLPISKARGYKPGFFSFNVDGGRCEMCEGEGIITVGMQFMADVHLPCESCEGRRYKAETLEVKYHEKNIADLLEMDISEALAFFKERKGTLEDKIVSKIQPLEDVGLGYIKMGQSSSTLSGGEAQRIKLASFLTKSAGAQGNVFIFDEPTTGLHYYDIEKLLIALQRLIDAGNSIIVIEHNGDVIKCADWVIDIGPEGGDKGGKIVFTGTPEELILEKDNYTGKFLMGKFEN